MRRLVLAASSLYAAAVFGFIFLPVADTGPVFAAGDVLPDPTLHRPVAALV